MVGYEAVSPAKGTAKALELEMSMKTEASMWKDDSSKTEDCSMTSDGSGSDHDEHDGQPRIRRIALSLSLWINVAITITKLAAFIHTRSLSVLASLVDSFLDVASQLVLNYTEKHSSIQRSSALYPAGASRLEPIGVLICAALMGMASFEVIKESITELVEQTHTFEGKSLASFWSLIVVVIIKLALLWLCKRASRASLQVTDANLEAVALDHWNDALSNAVAAVALLLALQNAHLWWVDPAGAIVISLYIAYAWLDTGREQIGQLTGKAAPEDFLEELHEIASTFDDRLMVDVCRAYHFGPNFLVEIEIVLPKETRLSESHDLGMELQYEIESREDVDRCFVHIDYETRDYDEHVVSKVPEWREKHRGGTRQRSYSENCV